MPEEETLTLSCLDARDPLQQLESRVSALEQGRLTPEQVQQLVEEIEKRLAMRWRMHSALAPGRIRN